MEEGRFSSWAAELGRWTAICPVRRHAAPAPTDGVGSPDAQSRDKRRAVMGRILSSYFSRLCDLWPRKKTRWGSSEGHGGRRRTNRHWSTGMTLAGRPQHTRQLDCQPRIWFVFLGREDASFLVGEPLVWLGRRSLFVVGGEVVSCNPGCDSHPQVSLAMLASQPRFGGLP